MACIPLGMLPVHALVLDYHYGHWSTPTTRRLEMTADRPLSYQEYIAWRENRNQASQRTAPAAQVDREASAVVGVMDQLAAVQPPAEGSLYEEYSPPAVRAHPFYEEYSPPSPPAERAHPLYEEYSPPDVRARSLYKEASPPAEPTRSLHEDYSTRYLAQQSIDQGQQADGDSVQIKMAAFVGKIVKKLELPAAWQLGRTELGEDDPIAPTQAVWSPSPSGSNMDGAVVAKAPGETRAQPEVSAAKKPDLMQKIKDAGVAGIVSYMFWELAFWGR